MLEKEEDLTITAKRSELEAIVREQVQLALQRELPHECWTCKHFYILKGNLNKSCNAGTKHKIIDGECSDWRLQPDPNLRTRRVY